MFCFSLSKRNSFPDSSFIAKNQFFLLSHAMPDISLSLISSLVTRGEEKSYRGGDLSTSFFRWQAEVNTKNVININPIFKKCPNKNGLLLFLFKFIISNF